MPTTPAQGHSCEVNYEELADNDVGLDDELLDDRSTARSITDPIRAEVPLYTHATAFRLRVRGGEDALERALAAVDLGFLSEGWCYTRRRQDGWRAQLHGAVWLGGRKPGYGKNKTSPMVSFNSRFGLSLYVLGHEVTSDAAYLDVSTVRFGDIDRLLVRMGLGDDDYQVEYLTQAERYMVLMPHEARSLAAALGGQEVQGKHREAAKGFLVQEITFPVRVRTRGNMSATLKIYRVSAGSTTAYRVEASLRGNRQTGKTFFPEDIDRLDELLLDLVDTYDLHPVAKPAKWEPVLPTRVDLAPRDVALRRMRGGAWRGKKVTPQVRQAVADLHTPPGGSGWLWALPASTEGTSTRVNTDTPFSAPPSASPSSVSTSPSPTPSPSSSPPVVEWERLPEDPALPGLTLYRRKGQEVVRVPARTGPWSTTDPYLALLDEVERGTELTEVVLDAQHDPTELVDRIADRFNGKASLFLRAQVDATGRPDTWSGLLPRLARYSPDETSEVFVFVVDVSAISTVHEAGAGFDPVKGFLPSPLRKLRGKGAAASAAHWHAWAMAGLLADDLEAIRDFCEHGGGRAVLLTVDSRPARGQADFEKSHGWRDTRVRSLVGDAGRHCCHRRAFIERNRWGEVRQVVLWRDGAEGKTGRVLYQATRPEKAPRRPRGASGGGTAV